jgi:hypothetical protein
MAGYVVGSLFVLLWMWRRRVRTVRRRDLLSTTFADTTSGIPRDYGWIGHVRPFPLGPALPAPVAPARPEAEDADGTGEPVA